jgi:hypothetical protein
MVCAILGSKNSGSKVMRFETAGKLNLELAGLQKWASRRPDALGPEEIKGAATRWL